MAVRQIKYTVYADRLEPSVKQFGGMQGDHKATEVLFEISGSLYEILKEQAESTNGRLIYRFDGYDGAGGVHSCDTTDLPEEDGQELLVMLKYPLEEWITRYGGIIKVVLVISLLKDDLTEMELYNYPAVIQLKNLPTGATVPGENHESISTLAQVAKESAEIAAKAKEEAVAAQIKAEENAEEVIGRIEPLEDDVAYLSTHAATKQYVDDAVASGKEVSQEYVDNAIAGVKDIAENNESDIEVIGQITGTLQSKVQGLEDDVETIKQGYVSVDYVNEKFTTGETVDRKIAEYDLTVQETYATKNEMASLEDDIGYIHEHYATKQYVDDAVASSGGGVSSWNDLTDKPFYTEDAWQELLPTTTLPFTLEDGMSAFFTTPTAEMIEIYQGEWSKAIVIWDGVEYECEPKMFYSALKAIGNVEFIEGTGDSGEPFALFVDSDGSLLGSPTAVVVSIEDTMNEVASSTHSVGVSLLAETIHPIDTKFIDKLSWNKISDKPFGDFTAGTVIADEDVVISSSGTPTPLTVDINKIFNGVQYIITINDTVYTTQGASQDGIKGFEITDPENAANEIFWYMSVWGGFYSDTLTEGETYHIKIAFAEDYVKTLESKYLPDTLYTEIDQRIEESIGDIETLLGGI